MLEQILPCEVAVVEAFRDDPAATLFPGERAVIARAIARRRTEFATGRSCARAALARLGEPPAPILRGPRGAPQWPAGVTGSITHCAGYRAAAVARIGDVLALGLDAEPNEKLPDGVPETIALAEERDELARLAAAEPGICWDRLLFSAKESVYKAWFPMTRQWLDFKSAHITVDPLNGTFRARLLVPGLLVNGVPLSVMRGRWLAARGLLATATVIAAWPADVMCRGALCGVRYAACVMRGPARG
jgi:4'-phosphopantetheinyl transferase EntD